MSKHRTEIVRLWRNLDGIERAMTAGRVPRSSKEWRRVNDALILATSRAMGAGISAGLIIWWLKTERERRS